MKEVDNYNYRTYNIGPKIVIFIPICRNSETEKKNQPLPRNLKNVVIWWNWKIFCYLISRIWAPGRTVGGSRARRPCNESPRSELSMTTSSELPESRKFIPMRIWKPLNHKFIQLTIWKLADLSIILKWRFSYHELIA